MSATLDFRMRTADDYAVNVYSVHLRCPGISHVDTGIYVLAKVPNVFGRYAILFSKR